VAAALWVLARERRHARGAGDSVWGHSDGWRLNAELNRTLQFETGVDQPALASVVVQYAADGLLVSAGEGTTGDAASFSRAALQAEGESLFHLQWGPGGVRLQIEPDEERLRITLGQDEYRLRWRDPRQPVIEGYLADNSLAAPMPGRIIAHLAAAGSTVAKGTALLIMEAMKMEHTICAPANGTVRAYLAAVGQQVREGTELIDFEPQR
jgi:3-methylcrotonyl-CoA carboxylase alpha subunit